ncbi:MAG: type II and III secretion system protein [Planctomycetota bacterium]
MRTNLTQHAFFNLPNLSRLGVFVMPILAGCCAPRPLPPRVSVDELVAMSLATSSADRGGNEPYCETTIEETVTDEMVLEQPPWFEDAPQFEPISTEIELQSMDVDASAPTAEPTVKRIPNHLPPVDPVDGSAAVIARVDFEDELRLSEEFIETDVREALTTLCLETGLDLVMDDNVTGIVNTRIDDLTIDRAIEKLLMPLGFASVRRGDQMIVADPQPESPLFPLIATKHRYEPRHQEITTLIEAVPQNWLQYVTQIEQAKLLIVEAPANIADDILNRFAEIDQPIPQVVLEAIICVVSPDSGFQFGLDWQHAVEIEDASALALGATGLAINGNISNEGLNQVFSDFSSTSTFIKLLNEHGYLTIRATPHVMAEDGEQANIAINRETFFSVQPPGATGNNAVFFQQDIQKVDAGISLDITPHIRGDVVTIDIEKAEVSEDVRIANTELALNPFPIINRRSVSTTVTVKDRRTIVIGGLVQQETIDRVNRVPGLSRLPLVGYLFETVQRQTRDAEVLIFISPRIVHQPGSACLQTTVTP